MRPYLPKNKVFEPRVLFAIVYLSIYFVMVHLLINEMPYATVTKNSLNKKISQLLNIEFL